MKPMRRSLLLPLGLGLVTLLLPAPGLAQSYSHARIVRLSFVEGTVAVQRPELADWAAAPINTPIQEGFKLSTAESSFAEVEFENTSTARLGQLSLLEFTQLALMPSGGRVNRLQLHQGYATFNVIPEGDDIYEVKGPDATLTPNGKTLFRLDLDQGLMRVEVFRGAVEVTTPYGSERLVHNMVLELRPGAEPAVQVSQGITRDDWDEWVEQREEQAVVSRNHPAPGVYSNDVTSLLYGWNDLWNYGNWSYIPGHGYGWAPTVPYGWAPYRIGRWCWYPNLGYVWISQEPWGWLPYHYGDWIYRAGPGWCWIPNSFASWAPALVNWYQGAGWIGWTPRARAALGPPSNCPQGTGCTTAVSVETFQNGGAVSPTNMLAVDPAQGRPVARPDVAPTQLGMLPGFPVPGGVTIRVRRYTAQDEPLPGSRRIPGDNPHGIVAGASPAASVPARSPAGNALASPAPAESDIVFDPAGRRYVNRQRIGLTPPSGPSPQPASALASSAPGAVPVAVAPESSREESRSVPNHPGSQGNYPRSLLAAPLVGQADPGERSAPATDLLRRTSPGSRPVTAPRVETAAPSRSLSLPATRPELSAPRSAPVPRPSPRFESGSVSHPALGSSSGSFGHSGGSIGGRTGGSDHTARGALGAPRP